ncbi:hypothetical protein KH388_22190 [Serratia rubidaea]|nr:hypothetical protein [Serratia rubidaea]
MIKLLLSVVAAGLRNGKWVVVGAVVLGVAGVMVTLLLERNAARRTVAEQTRALALRQTQIVQLQTGVTQLRQRIDRQNQAVDMLKADAAARQQAAAEAMARALQAGETWQAQIRRLNAKNRAAEAGKGRTCDDALREWRAGR